DNTIVVLTGPLTGTMMPGSGRFEIASRSPLTTGFGLASAGGNFGPEVKFAGYDGIIITGESPTPVYLKISDNNAEICDASELWGLTTSETRKKLANFHDKRSKSICIGPAGENLVLYACVAASDHNYAGRTGIGAVMGSKKLKAVSVRGTSKPEIADPDAFKAVREKCLKAIKEDPTCNSYTAYGTDGSMQLGMLVSDVPTKNWSVAYWEEGADRLNGITMADTILSGKKACYACPIACKRVVTIPDGPYKMENAAGPEYETAAAMGTLQMIDDLEAVCAANIACNDLGMDSISAGNSIAFLRECYDKKIIGDSETGGIALTWGDPGQVIQLLNMTSSREGIGNLLAEGVKRMSEKIGKGSEKFAVHSKGLEAPMHDPRAYHGLALAYATSPRGACHIKHLDMVVEMGLYSYPEFGLDGSYQPLSKKGKAEMIAACENAGIVAESAVMCMFVTWPLSYKNHILPALNAVTGMDWTIDELTAIGERGWFVQRSFANLCGLDSKHDILPERVLNPHPEGEPSGLDKIVHQMTSFRPPSLPMIKNVSVGMINRIFPVQKAVVQNLGKVMFMRKLKKEEVLKKGTPDLQYMMREYYTVRELDKNGYPRPKKLKEMQLSEISVLLHGEA
ncbi:MAG TPA: aldehyde ferredoxin oxidoreductase family protein, partial [bacterium]|nr:aldehyde ferredoxin oxidoreductase family protein [bacterium]